MADNNEKNDYGQPWYIMCHLNPNLINTLLSKEQSGAFLADGEAPLAPFRFFIPYLYAPNADLRGDFRRFVFIQTSAERIATLVNAGWNTQTRLRMRHYRNHEGHEVVASDREVRLIKELFQNRNLDFYIDKPIDEFKAEDRVIINIGPWKGYEGQILKVKIREGRATMKVGLNLLGLAESIVFTNLKTGDVIFKDDERRDMMSDDPVGCLESEVLSLLSRRFGRSHTPDQQAADGRRLRQLKAFDHVLVEEDDADFLRFLSLRLICAALRGSSKKGSLQRELRRHLPDDKQPADDQQAYAVVALFVATKNADYRTVLKNYRSGHPDFPEVLRCYLSILKKMRAKVKKSK